MHGALDRMVVGKADDCHHTALCLKFFLCENDFDDDIISERIDGLHTIVAYTKRCSHIHFRTMALDRCGPAISPDCVFFPPASNLELIHACLYL